MQKTSDSYGTGIIRIELHLQSLRMLFNGVGVGVAKQEKNSVLGVKLLCASNIIAVLASWSARYRAQKLSPAEAWIIINLVSLLFPPAGVAIYNPNAVVGDALGIFLLGGAIIGINSGFGRHSIVPSPPSHLCLAISPHLLTDPHRHGRIHFFL